MLLMPSVTSAFSPAINVLAVKWTQNDHMHACTWFWNISPHDPVISPLNSNHDSLCCHTAICPLLYFYSNISPPWKYSPTTATRLYVRHSLYVLLAMKLHRRCVLWPRSRDFGPAGRFVDLCRQGHSQLTSRYLHADDVDSHWYHYGCCPRRS